MQPNGPNSVSPAQPGRDGQVGRSATVALDADGLPLTGARGDGAGCKPVFSFQLDDPPTNGGVGPAGGDASAGGPGGDGSHGGTLEHHVEVIKGGLVFDVSGGQGGNGGVGGDGAPGGRGGPGGDGNGCEPSGLGGPGGAGGDGGAGGAAGNGGDVGWLFIYYVSDQSASQPMQISS